MSASSGDHNEEDDEDEDEKRVMTRSRCTATREVKSRHEVRVFNRERSNTGYDGPCHLAILCEEACRFPIIEL